MINQGFKTAGMTPIEMIAICSGISYEYVQKHFRAPTLKQIYEVFDDKKPTKTLSGKYPLPVNKAFIESIKITDSELERRYGSLDFVPLGQAVWEHLTWRKEEYTDWFTSFLSHVYLMSRQIRFMSLCMRVARNATNPLLIPQPMSLNEFARLYSGAY